MLLGMPTLVEHHTLAGNIRLCTRLGLRFIELNMNFPEYQLDQLAQTDALLRAGEHAGIFFTLHLDDGMNIADFNPLVSSAYQETVCRAILAAKKLLPLRDHAGAAYHPLVLNMHLHRGAVMTLPTEKVCMFRRNMEDYLRIVTEFRRRCEDWIGDSPIRIAIENTDGFTDYQQAAVTCMLESHVFGLTWDIGHSKVRHESDMPFLLAHRERLLHFHLHDATETPPRDHLALGDGAIDLMDRLSAAQSACATCVLETKTAAALKQSVHWLSKNWYRCSASP